MKRECSSWWALVVLVVWLALMVVVLCEVRMVHGDELSPGQCKEERRLIVDSCKPVVLGQSASPACCERVRVSHFAECVCPVVDPKLAALITVNQAIKVLQDCGRTVPPHFTCGSLTFP